MNPNLLVTLFATCIALLTSDAQQAEPNPRLDARSQAAQQGLWQNLGWEADSRGQKIGMAHLRVKAESNGLPNNNKGHVRIP